jgi:hypothetical protein
MTTRNRPAVLIVMILALCGGLHASIAFNPPNPTARQTVTFTLIPQFPNLEPEHQITWSFGDGASEKRPINQLTISHSYAAPGIYSVTANYHYVTPTTGVAQTTDTVRVIVSAAARTVAFHPGNPNTCESVAFQAKGFTATTLRWEFGDGVVLSGGGNTVSHAYPGAGTFTARIFDNNGRDPNPVTAKVIVADKRSIKILTASPKVGQPTSFQAVGFAKPCIRWDFGDGQSIPNGTSTAGHVYSNPGTYQVKATDDCGASPCAAGISVSAAAFAPPVPQTTLIAPSGALRFENGAGSISVERSMAGLAAYADLKIGGSGVLQIEWRVDGKFLKTATQTVGASGQVTIDSGKVPGLPTAAVGAHSVSLVIVKPEGGLTIPAITYQVLSPQIVSTFPLAENPQAPIVQAIVPGTLDPGKGYLLDLKGMRLTTDTVVSLGGGIAINGFTLINPMRASLSVFVSSTAKPGDHPAKAENDKGLNIGPGKVAVAEVKPSSAQAQPLNLICTDLSTLAVESIALTGPAWKSQSMAFAGIEEGSGNAKYAQEQVELRVPVIDDLTVLRWLSKGPIYDALEVRFFDAHGNALLMAKKINGASTSLPLTGAVIAELFSHIQDGNGLLSAQAKKYAGPGSGVKSAVSMVNTSNMSPQELEALRIKQLYDEAMRKADVAWQVVGFRKFACVYDSVKKTPSQIDQTVEIARSEIWMFQLPDRPNGLTCPTAGMQKNSAKIRIANMTRSARDSSSRRRPAGASATESVTDYVGDEFAVSGSFDLARSPYGSHMISGANPQIPNLFIDWGDGSPASTLDVKIAGSQEKDWKKSVAVEILASAGNRHSYKKAGSDYTIRVFELSEDDVQKPAANFLAVLGGKLKPKESSSSSSGYGSPYQILTEQQGAGGPHVAETEYESFADVLDRAYMIFCQPVTIQPYRDTCVDKPLNLLGIEIIDFPGHSLMIKVGGKKPGDINLKPSQAKDYAAKQIDAVAVSCDTALYAVAELTYFGTGFVELVWKVDGEVRETRRIQGKLTSEERPNLSSGQAADCSNPRQSRITFDSGPGVLPVKDALGMHIVTVEARVVPEFGVPNLDGFATEAVFNLGSTIGKAKNGGAPGNGPFASPAEPGVMPPDPLIEALTDAQGKGQSVPQVGFLNPDNVSGGSPAAVFINDSFPSADSDIFSQMAPGTAESPNFVRSEAKRYQVNEVRNQLGCLILLPDAGGGFFRLTDMSASIVLDEADETYSAKGALHIWYRTGPDSIAEKIVPNIVFAKWSITEESGEVTNGTLDTGTNVIDFVFPGFIGSAVLKHIEGGVAASVPKPMSATFDFKLGSHLLKRIENGGNVAASVQNARGRLSAKGDWIAGDLKLEKSEFGYTGFSIHSEQVTIDISAQESPAPYPSAGPDWLGVHLGHAAVTPYTLSFTPTEGSGFAMNTTQEWVIRNGGLNGRAKSTAFQSDVALGSFDFANVEFGATDDVPAGTYHDITVKVPWLNTTLTGDAVLQQKSGGYEYETVLTLDNHPPVALSYSDPAKQGRITMTASDFRFRSTAGPGSALPAAECNLVFGLECEGKPFAQFASPDFDFLFDGRALFGGQKSSETFPLSGPTAFGQSAADLNQATVTVVPDPDRLDVAVGIKLHYASDPGQSAYVPAGGAAIHYRIFKSGNDYGLSGPVSQGDPIKMVFPLGSADFGSSFSPEYTPEGAQSSSSGGAGPSGPSVGEPPPGDGVSFSGKRFSAKFLMSVFGTDKTIDALFIMGRNDQGSYFLTVADVKGFNIPLSPIPLAIFGFKGGFGYHFDALTLAAADENAQPNMGITAAFGAGVSLGTSADNGFILKADAFLAMDTGGTFLMQFSNGRLLNQGNFGGFLRYSNKIFDGALFGELAMFDQIKVVEFSLGTQADPAVSFLFGGGTWHIYAGKKGGPRIAGSVWGNNADGYLMLDSTGLETGGAVTCVIPPGADKLPIGVFVKSKLDIGVRIYIDPFHIYGQFGAGVGVGGCINILGEKVCKEFTVDATIKAEAPNPTRIEVCFDIDWPIVGEKSYCVGM